ncbi:MAG: hypothetical protein GY803_27760, partial [Chloroflexi bacterium]|nr:hypothetical protein [Chloroflexota bacterium]
VAFLYEPRSYYCDRDCRPDSKIDELGHWRYLYGGAGNTAAALHANDVTHILLYQIGYTFMAGGEETAVTTLLENLQAHHLNPIADIAGAYILYELQP